MSEVTELLASSRQGDPAAVDRLYQLLYPVLRQIARAKLRGEGGPTLLDTTSLVNESYLKLVGVERLPVQDRAHFLAYAARAMRSIIVDLVRESKSQRRGGEERLLTLNTELGDGLRADDEQILLVHAALEELAQIDARLVQVVEMRYFVGLEVQEIAEALDITPRTVQRDWEKARSFLYDSLRQD